MAEYEYPGGWKPIRYEQRCADRRLLLTAALATAIDVCRKRSDIARLLVFGSYARDAVTPWSDLDLAVIADGDPTAAVAAMYAAGTLGDVIGVCADRWRERLQRNPFGETILREATEVYARPEG